MSNSNYHWSFRCLFAHISTQQTSQHLTSYLFSPIPLSVLSPKPASSLNLSEINTLPSSCPPDIGAIDMICTRISNNLSVFTVNAFYFRCSALGTVRLLAEPPLAWPFLDYFFSPGRDLWISFSLCYCFFFLCSCLSS